MTQNNGQVPEQDETVVRRVSEIGRIPVSETRAAKAVVEAQKIVANAKAQVQDGSHPETLAQQSHKAAAIFPTIFDDSPGMARSDEGLMPKSMGEKLMTYKPLFATLAAILLGGVFWFSQGNPANHAYALEQVIESFRNATNGRYEMTVKPDGQPAQTHRVTFAPGVDRREDSERVAIMNWELGRGIELDIDAKRAKKLYFGSMADLPAGQRASVRQTMQRQSNPFAGILQHLNEAASDPIARVTWLGEKTADGRTIVGRSVEGGKVARAEFWTDKETGAPFSIELKPLNKPAKLTLSNCEFNIKLNEALFSLTPPDGYTVIEGSRIPPHESEADFVEALREVCRVRGGDFPSSITGNGYSETMSEYSASQGGSPSQAQMRKAFETQQGLKFTNHVSNAFYAGKGAKLGQSDRPILWYQQEDGYRVIFADLSTKTVAESPQHDAAVRIK